MKFEEVENYCWNIFDMIKVWFYKDFFFRLFGKLILNCNVSVIWDVVWFID